MGQPIEDAAWMAVVLDSPVGGSYLSEDGSDQSAAGLDLLAESGMAAPEVAGMNHRAGEATVRAGQSDLYQIDWWLEGGSYQTDWSVPAHSFQIDWLGAVKLERGQRRLKRRLRKLP